MRERGKKKGWNSCRNMSCGKCLIEENNKRVLSGYVKLFTSSSLHKTSKDLD